MFGGAIGYWQGSLAYLRDDIEALKPSMFLGVPRVLDKVYSAIMSTVNSGGFLRKVIFDMAFQRKMKYIKLGAPSTKVSLGLSLAMFGLHQVPMRFVFELLSITQLGDEKTRCSFAFCSLYLTNPCLHLGITTCRQDHLEENFKFIWGKYEANCFRWLTFEQGH